MGRQHEMAIPFDNTYAQLPEVFFSKGKPATVPKPEWVRVNVELASELGIDPEWLSSEAGLGILSGNEFADGSEPLSQAYAGHQFGGWVPQLGDGRAILLGEVVDGSGIRRDIQLKGSGRTPYSRGGDGKSPLGPVLREYIVSEAMAVLGVPTTRALAAVSTGEPVYREEALPGGVFTRVASSHLRVGTFQYFYARNDRESLQALADYAIARHDPSAAKSDEPILSFLEGVVERQARLIAHWMSLGFIHGVMNTDNMTVSGETIDFGPCAFQDGFHPERVFSSIDRQGRYAWINQPAAGQWNLARLAESLLPLLPGEEKENVSAVEQALTGFGNQFRQAYFSRFRAKLGIRESGEKSEDFVEKTLGMLGEEETDFTIFFRDLTRSADGSCASPESLFSDIEMFTRWKEEWDEVLGETGPDVSVMKRSNPVRIPRNHRVEQAIDSAQGGDLQPFHDLVDALVHPYDEDASLTKYEESPKAAERVTKTFCGT